MIGRAQISWSLVKALYDSGTFPKASNPYLNLGRYPFFNIKTSVSGVVSSLDSI